NDPDPAKRRGHVTSINVFDDLGNTHKMNVTIWKVTDNQWTAELDLADAELMSAGISGQAGSNPLGGNKRFNLNFSPDGKLQSISAGADTQTTGDLTVDLSYKMAGNPQTRNIKLQLGEAGKFNGVTQFSSDFTTKAVEQDGYT